MTESLHPQGIPPQIKIWLRRAAILVVAVALCGAAGAETPSPELRVTLLGTGNPRPSLERFGPSALVEAGRHRLLIDAGRGTTMRLFQIGGGELLSGVDLVLLTHLHSDHTVGLPDLWLTGWIFARDRPLPVYGPPGTVSMMRHLEKAFAFDVGIRRDVDEGYHPAGVEVQALDIDPGVVFERDGLKITAFPVDHRPVAPAYGYRVDYAGRSVAFSGDTRPSPTLVEHARGVDLLIHEVISPEVERRRAQVKGDDRIQKVIEHHTTPEDAGRIFEQVKPRLAVYSHIVPSPTRPEDLIPATRRTYRGRLEVGYDLMTIQVGERIKVGKRRAISDR